jgi:RNA polymerase sigma-70 factor (ECF subfamily)
MVSQISAAPDEFRAFFDAHAAFVWRVARYLGTPAADLDDVCQEVFLVVSRRLGEHDPARGSVRTWVFGIVRNVVRNDSRRHRRRHEVVVATMPEPEVNSSDRTEVRWMCAALLDALGDEQRTVLMLHDLEEMPIPEVAEAVGIPLATAYSRLRLARARALAWLTANGGSGT